MALNVQDNNFILPIDIAAAGKVTKELQTAGTYVDKNIKIEVNTPDGSLKVKQEGTLSASVSVDANIYTSDTETKYPLTVKGDASITDVQVGVANEGFVDSTDTVTINGSSAPQASKTVYIKAGSLSGSGTASAEGGNGLALGAKQESAPQSGFYVKASAAGGASVATAGWVDKTTPSVSVNGDSYYPIDAATLANAGTADKVYAEEAGPVLVSGGYLYINKGYIGDTKIPLADLVPNEANVTAGENGNSHLIYKTVSVYDKDGALIAGTMGDAALNDIVANQASANISTVSVAANEDGSAFKVTGSGAISGTASVSVATAGYAKSDLTKSGAIEGSASVDASLAKIAVSASAAAANLTVTPVIAKDSSSAKATGAITTTAPSGHFVAVSADAVAASTTVSPTVTTAGYGTADTFSATATTVTAGSNASGLYYVPITEASHTVSKEASSVTSASATVSSAVVDENASEVTLLSIAPEGRYLKISAAATAQNGSVTTNAKCVSTEGYITASTQTLPITESVSVGVTNAADKFIKIYNGELVESV